MFITIKNYVFIVEIFYTRTIDPIKPTFKSMIAKNLTTFLKMVLC